MRNFMSFGFQTKTVEESGQFEGHGAVFGSQDSGRDVIAAGAFKRTLEEHAAKGTRPALLWQHDMHQPIGVYEELREDSRGLYVKGKLALETTRGQEAHTLLKMGALDGLSIGYMTREYEMNEETDVRTLKDVDLWEVSLVTFPMNEEARVAAVKRAVDAGELPTIREFEIMLQRDAGFTRSQARVIATRGYKALDADLQDAIDEDATAQDGLQDAVDPDELKEIGSGLARLRDLMKS